MSKHKNTSVLRPAQTQERLTSKKKNSYSPSEVYLCVLGNGAAGSPRSLYMFCDHTRYLFNCGEGTQRLAHEYKLKLSKLEHIFITHRSWDNIGGLLGLSLTIQDIGVPEITLHGPPEIEDLYYLTKSFVMTRAITVNKWHHEDRPFTDSCMEVQCIPIYSTKVCFTQIMPSNSNGSDLRSEEWHCGKKRKLSDEEPAPDMVVAFACKGHSKKGRLVIEKCVEQGVPSGPLLGKLKNGEDITLPSGKIVLSKDVTSPDEPCPVFLVVECPSEDFLDPFVSEERFKIYQCSSADENAQLVVHFTSPSIMKMQKYQEWMVRFPVTTCHLVINEDSCNSNSVAIHRVQCLLNLLHPRIFSLLHETELPEELSNSTSNIVQSDTLYRYHLRPQKGLDKSLRVHCEPDTYREEAKNTPGFEDSLRTLKQSLQKFEEENYEGTDYPEVVFLGTGSCLPSKVRNVSCILLNICSDVSILLDCGEGSYCQLLRLYGAEEANSILKKLTLIFISHMHADHHLGLFTILKRRKKIFDSLKMDCYPVIVIAPSCIKNWMESYDKNFDSISQLYRFIDCSALIFGEREISAEDEKHISNVYQDIQICTVPVQHCHNAYGITLQIESKWKLVYSGDTVPCQRLIDAGKDCTLLIHEATMEDDLSDEAALKMHSTTSQAISVAEKMNARYTILTHFSQRYAKVPLFNEKLKSHIGCAFDNMKIRNCDLPIVPLLIPTLEILFAEHIEKLQDKGHKRKEKLKRISDSLENH